jgi:hypothetical protein
VESAEGSLYVGEWLYAFSSPPPNWGRQVAVPGAVPWGGGSRDQFMGEGKQSCRSGAQGC